MTADNFRFVFSILIFNFHYGLAFYPGPHEYCLSPLNRSDCGKPSTPVFSYYKPGSRCEIEYWRGCPTLNKFNDEFLCSHFCIGKIFGLSQSKDIPLEIIDEDICSKPLDRGDCGSTPVVVYTFDGICLEAVWKGCTSVNIFNSHTECLSKCDPSMKAWKWEIEILGLESVEKLSNLVDNVVQNVQKEVKDEVEKLIFKVDPVVTEEANATEVTETTKPTETTEVTETTKATEATTVIETTEATVATTVAETTEATEATTVAETTEATTVAETTEATTVAETTEATTIAETTVATEATTVAETTEATTPTTTTDAGEAPENEIT